MIIGELLVCIILAIIFLLLVWPSDSIDEPERGFNDLKE